MVRKVCASKVRKRVLHGDQYLSKGQLKKLLKYVENTADLARQRGSRRAIIDELIVLTMAYTGLKVKELRSLNIRDVSVRYKSFITVRDSKGKISRKMVIHAELAKKLERFIKLYRKKTRRTAPLFMSEQGNRLGYHSIYSKVKSVGKKSGIGKLHPNMLRHTFLLELFAREKDLKLVQEQAGYSSIRAASAYFNTIIKQSSKRE